jgi:ABC-type branched-subunit amino acid transport system permease subunit
VDLVTKIMVYAIFALSLELLVGSTGLVCFGQAAFFGIGAYAAVLLTPGGRRRIAAVAAAGVHRWRRPPMRWWWARCRCAPRACTSSWSRWPLRRWPTTWCTTPRWAAAPTASTSTASRCWAAAGPGQAAGVVRLHAGLPGGGVRLPGGAAALALRPRAGRHRSMSSACAPPAFPPTRTSWRPSPCRAASPGWRASCSP